MDQLRIRTYNVLFGDAILITFPEVTEDGTTKIRNILIDFGNLPSAHGAAGKDDVFEPIIKDIVKELNGQPLDLYIMTHEHMDHIQGLLYSEKKFYKADEKELHGILKTRHAWLTASADDDYYNNFSDAKEKKLMSEKLLDNIETYFNALKANGEEISEAVWVLWANNSPHTTNDCVDYIQSLAPNTTHYVHREIEKANLHPFTEAKIEIWAPEQDTSTYYNMLQFMPMELGVTKEEAADQQCTLTRVTPPPGVYSGAFYNLVKMRGCYLENLLAIDKANNNTSVVFCLEWRGIRLLFTGDAEKESWRMIDEKVKLSPVHFLKVSHHASETGLPDIDILDKFYPENKTDNVTRYAVVSTFEGSRWKSIPDPKTLDEIRKRCDRFIEVHKEKPKGDHFDIFYDASPQQEKFVGSKTSDVYHKPSCYWATRISPTKKVWFASAQDAENQGYRACKSL